MKRRVIGHIVREGTRRGRGRYQRTSVIPGTPLVWGPKAQAYRWTPGDRVGAEVACADLHYGCRIVNIVRCA